jgi:hypothetical protein
MPPFPPSSPLSAAVSEPEPNHDVALSVYLCICLTLALSLSPPLSLSPSLSLSLFVYAIDSPAIPSFLPSGMRCNYNSVPSTWNSIDQLIPITCGARSTQPSLARSVSLLVLNCAQVAVNQPHVPHLSKLETDHSAALPCPALNDPLPPLVCPLSSARTQGKCFIRGTRPKDAIVVDIFRAGSSSALGMNCGSDLDGLN